MEILQFEKNDSNFFDIPLYPKCKINQFDVSKSLSKLLEKIDEFISDQCKYVSITPPQITTSYELVFTSHTFTPSSKVHNFVEEKDEKEENVKKFYNRMAEALKLLNKLEMVYFTEVLYNKRKSIADCAEYLNMSPYLFKPIRESCIVKLSTLLDCAVLK